MNGHKKLILDAHRYAINNVVRLISIISMLSSGYSKSAITSTMMWIPKKQSCFFFFFSSVDFSHITKRSCEPNESGKSHQSELYWELYIVWKQCGNKVHTEKPGRWRGRKGNTERVQINTATKDNSQEFTVHVWTHPKITHSFLWTDSLSERQTTLLEFMKT